MEVKDKPHPGFSRAGALSFWVSILLFLLTQFLTQACFIEAVMNLDLGHSFAFVVPVTKWVELESVHFSLFKNASVILNQLATWLWKCSPTGSDQRSTEPNVLYPAMYHIPIIAQNQMLKNEYDGRNDQEQGRLWSYKISNHHQLGHFPRQLCVLYIHKQAKFSIQSA